MVYTGVHSVTSWDVVLQLGPSREGLRYTMVLAGFILQQVTLQYADSARTSLYIGEIFPMLDAGMCDTA